MPSVLHHQIPASLAYHAVGLLWDASATVGTEFMLTPSTRILPASIAEHTARLPCGGTAAHVPHASGVGGHACGQGWCSSWRRGSPCQRRQARGRLAATGTASSWVCPTARRPPAPGSTVNHIVPLLYTVKLWVKSCQDGGLERQGDSGSGMYTQSVLSHGGRECMFRVDGVPVDVLDA